MKKSTALIVKNGDKNVELDYDNLRETVLTYRAINHPLRKQVLELLESNERMTVTDIYIKLRIEQSVASQHLAILRTRGFVKAERTGKFIYYSVDAERIAKVNASMTALNA